MKTVYLALLLGSLALAAASSTGLPQQNGALGASGNLVLIEGLGSPGEGWVQMAPSGSMLQGPTDGQRTGGLATFPFSELGDTKVLINMEYASWVYVAGQKTKVTYLGGKDGGVMASAAASPISISGLQDSGFFEVREVNGGTLTLEGNSDYLFNPDSFSWMKLPVGAKVRLLRE